MSTNSRSEFRDGQIVYIHHLHLDSIDLNRDCKRGQLTSADNEYAVKGKLRPMIVIGHNGEERLGVQWYWVIKLTTKKTQVSVRIGDVLENGRDSFAERRAYAYPENLFEAQVLKHLDRVNLQAILTITGIKPGAPLR